MAERMSLLTNVQVEVVQDERRLFRICGHRGHTAFLNAFRSNYEQRRPPRGPEHRVAVIHMALSMFDSAEVAREIAMRFAKLGDHIAIVDLQPRQGIASRRRAARAIGPFGAVQISSLRAPPML